MGNFNTRGKRVFSEALSTGIQILYEVGGISKLKNKTYKRRKNIDFEQLRLKLFTKYLECLKLSGSDEYAFDESIQELERLKEEYSIWKTWEVGLTNELFFFYMCRNEYSLKYTDPSTDRKLKADFIGKEPITNRSILIDVTTNIYTKLRKARSIDYWRKIRIRHKISGYDFEYYLAVVSIELNDISLQPLLLPVHEEGYLGIFFVKLYPRDDLYDPFKDNILAEPQAGVLYFDQYKYTGKCVEIVQDNIEDGWPEALPSFYADIEKIDEYIIERGHRVAKLYRTNLGILPACTYDYLCKAILYIDRETKRIRKDIYCNYFLTWKNKLLNTPSNKKIMKRIVGDYYEEPLEPI